MDKFKNKIEVCNSTVVIEGKTLYKILFTIYEKASFLYKLNVEKHDSNREIQDWITGCINFDELFVGNLKCFSNYVQVDTVVTERVKNKKFGCILSRVLLHLICAIDRVVITISNKGSYISQMLIEFAKSMVITSQ